MMNMDIAGVSSFSLTGNALLFRKTNSADATRRNKKEENRSGSALETRFISFDIDAEIADETDSETDSVKHTRSTNLGKLVDCSVNRVSKDVHKRKYKISDCNHLHQLEQRMNGVRAMRMRKIEANINRFIIDTNDTDDATDTNDNIDNKHVTFSGINARSKARNSAKITNSVLPRRLRGETGEHPIRAFHKHKVLVFAELFKKSKQADLGGHMVSSKAGDFQDEHERELQRAVEDAEERATRELRAAMKRLREDKEDEKERALKNQKDYYEKLSKRIEEQRNRAEEERERELTKKFMQQQDEALDRQWRECEKLKEEAIAAACEELTRKLRVEFNYEKEQAVAEALRIAKEKYLIRERNVIEKTRRECEEEARQEAARVAKLHQQEIDRCNQRYDLLEKKWLRELEHRKNVEQDFRALQEDYRRFMDYTDGMFHSDYLMQLRHMGQKLAEKQLSPVTYDDLEKQYDFT